MYLALFGFIDMFLFLYVFIPKLQSACQGQEVGGSFAIARGACMYVALLGGPRRALWAGRNVLDSRVKPPHAGGSLPGSSRARTLA